MRDRRNRQVDAIRLTLAQAFYVVFEGADEWSAIMRPFMATLPRRWDIFARVIDNFGDAGVSWRLARQLAAEHGVEVTLWLDQVAALAHIAPKLIHDKIEQDVQGVVVRRWQEPFAATRAADVVIEAFGCGLPE